MTIKVTLFNMIKKVLNLFCLVFAILSTTASGKRGRIYGGELAEPGQFPFIVTFTYEDDPLFEMCDGSILSENWIVTAAHCIVDYTQGIPPDLVIGVGSNRLDSNVTYYHIQQVVPNPQYDYTNAENDIGLVRLSSPINFTDTVKAIEIGNADANDTCMVAGWGITESESDPIELRYLNTFAIDTDECQVRWEDTDYDQYFGDKVICTFTKEEQGNCYGDSGGPLVSNEKLVGLVSTGVPCARGYPDVYTRTAAFADWITAVTGLTFNS